MRRFPTYILVTLFLSTTGCASIKQQSATMLPPWTPSTRSEVPAPEQIEEDRRAFLSHYEAWREQERQRSKDARKRAPWLRWGGLAIGTLLFLPAYIYGEDLIVSFIIASAPVIAGLGGSRRLQAEGRAYDQCARFLEGFVPAFERKWAPGHLPSIDSTWVQYRRDQITIAEQGPCR